MTWNESLTELARMVNEPEAATLSAPLGGELDTPFFTKELLETALLLSGQKMLRVCSLEHLEVIGSPALVKSSGAGTVSGDFSEYALTDDTVRVISVVIDGSLAVESSIAALYQRAKSTRTNTYSFAGGTLRFKGTNCSVVYVKELTLADWQASQILGSELDGEWLFEAYTILSISAGLPPYRV